MVILLSCEFEKFKLLKIKPEVVQNLKKKFLGSPGKKKTFSQSYVCIKYAFFLDNFDNFRAPEIFAEINIF